MFGAGDLPALLADQGVTVIAADGKTQTLGLYDKQNVQELAPTSGALLDVLHTALTIVTGSMSAAVEDQITVDGSPYVVRNVNPMDDGQLTELVIVAVKA